MKEKLDFFYTEAPQPHTARMREILKKHPEVRELLGPTPSTAVWTAAVVALQFAVAIWVQNQSWWLVALASWVVGAVCIHALFVIIHDCSHDLAFKRPFWNKALGVAANLPGVYPSAIGFRNYHLLHHRHLGEMYGDGDVPGPDEAKWVGNSALRKFLWISSTVLVQGGLRPVRIGKINVLEPWGIINGIFSIGSALLVFYFFGAKSLVYLVLSVLFGIGFHIVGGRWIQEHFVFKPGQETYSYYGPMNKLCFNMGYHNEHHDFMMIPWSRLPKLRQLAPEYYDTLFYHTSWTRVLFKFIFDPNMSLFSRYVRPDNEKLHPKKLMTTRDTQKIIQEGEQEVAGALSEN